MVFWFTILGWLFVQIPITTPIPEVARAADPELGAQIDQAMESLTANMDIAAVGLFSLLFLGGTLAGVLFWILNRNAKGSTQTVFGVLTGIGVAASMYGLIKLFPLMSDPEANNTLMKAMGVSPVAYMLFLLVFPFSLIALYLVKSSSINVQF